MQRRGAEQLLEGRHFRSPEIVHLEWHVRTTLDLVIEDGERGVKTLKVVVQFRLRLSW